jgi:hypothetical protein
LDTHKNPTEAALADDGRNTGVRFYGTIGGDLASTVMSPSYNFSESRAAIIPSQSLIFGHGLINLLTICFLLNKNHLSIIEIKSV